MMTDNPILDELYAIRERLLAEAGGDLHRFLAGVRDREAASGRLLVQRGEKESGPDPSLTNGCSGSAARAADLRADWGQTE
jgi:hypothetical protein